MRQLPFRKLTEIMRISGVPLYAHWSFLLLGVIILVAALQRPAEVLSAWAAYFIVILIHECGHMIAARRKRCAVFSMELHVIHGVCNFEEPWSRYDHAVIAWGGVLAQAAVAFPFLILVRVLGFTPFPAINTAIGILSYYNLALAFFNLLPIPGMDGAYAWALIPESIKRRRNRRQYGRNPRF